MITVDDAASRFKEILAAKPEWNYLSKSQFVEHLAIFVGWALRDAQWTIERARQESFLSTSLNYSSIAAFAEDREYVPRKPVPAEGNVTITNRGAATVYVPELTQFLSAKTQKTYTLMDAVELAAGASAAASIKQVDAVEVIETVLSSSAFYQVLFDTAYTDRISGIDVYVDEDGEGYVQWELSRLFQNTDETDLVYDEFFAHTNQIGVRFGNGVFGKIPPVNSTIKIVVWLTDGDTALMAGQALTMIGDLVDIENNAANLLVVSQDVISGGANRETGEELRRNLHYWPLYNDTLIWRDDYSYFLKKRFPEILWINVWGEEEAEEANGGVPDFDFYNKIFVSAYATDDTYTYRGSWAAGTSYAENDVVLIDDVGKLACVQAHISGEDEPEGEDDYWDEYVSELEENVLSELSTVRPLNRRFEWVDPELVTFGVQVGGKVSPRQTVTTVVTAIQALLIDSYGIDSPDRKTEVRIADIYAAISATGYFGDGGWFVVNQIGPTQAEALNEVLCVDPDQIVIEVSYL